MASKNLKESETTSLALRSGSRLLGVQALYQWEISKNRPVRIIQEFIEHRFGKTMGDLEFPNGDISFFSELIEGVIANQEEIDAMIAGTLADNWSLDRLDPILRAILRCGSFELGYRHDIPAKVTIAEYVATASAFFNAPEIGTVNGVLDRLARSLRPEEMGEENAKPKA